MQSHTLVKLTELSSVLATWSHTGPRKGHTEPPIGQVDPSELHVGHTRPRDGHTGHAQPLIGQVDCTELCTGHMEPHAGHTEPHEGHVGPQTGQDDHSELHVGHMKTRWPYWTMLSHTLVKMTVLSSVLATWSHTGPRKGHAEQPIGHVDHSEVHVGHVGHVMDTLAMLSH